MFSAQEYIIGWVVYLIAALGLLFVFWRMTRSIPWFYPKQYLRLIGAAFLLSPAVVDDAAAYLAPAWVMATLQLVFTGVDNFWPLARVVLMAALIAAMIYSLLLIALHLYRRQRRSAP
jgi:hypothetical protein